MNDNQANYIKNLISEAGKADEEFAVIASAYEATEESKKKEVLDGIISGLKAEKRTRNETLLVTDSTYTALRQAESATDQSTEREGLTEGNALSLLKKIRIDTGTAVPTQGQKEFLFKLIWRTSQNPDKESVNAQVATFNTSGAISVEIDRLKEVQKNDPNQPATPKQYNMLKSLLEKDGAENPAEAAKGFTKTSASEKIAELLEKHPKKEAVTQPVAETVAQVEVDPDLPA